MWTDLLMGDDGKRWGILIGVLNDDDEAFSCSSSEARPRFVLNRFEVCDASFDERFPNGDVIRISIRGIVVDEEDGGGELDDESA